MGADWSGRFDMAEIALLNGGNGQEIIKRSGRSPHPLWSLRVMFDTPEVIGAVHDSYVEAGARVITMNTYVATPPRMARDGDVSLFDAAHAQAGQVARDAVARSGKPVEIAGCLPPLVASYHAELRQGPVETARDYVRMAEAQRDVADIFLIETMSNIDEARAALLAAQAVGKPAFVGLSLKDDASNLLRSGETLDAALDVLGPMGPDGVMVNCSSPEAVTAALPKMSVLDVPFGGYANGFVAADRLAAGGTVNSLQARTDLSPEVYAGFARQWVDAGATIVGGCCEVGPAHIAHLAQVLEEDGHRLTGLVSKAGSGATPAVA